MFVQSIKFIESHHGNKKELSIYGQEYTSTTYKLAKMNLAIRGISANLGAVPADTFGRDQHPDLKADYIMANPPFNQKDWRADNELTDDPRWRGYEVPPTGNANYAWILNMVSKLSENGVAGFILANGALSGGGDEYKIRQKLIDNKLVEAILVLPQNMFYTTNISVTMWIVNHNKKARTVEVNGETKQYRDRENEILFMDLRQMGEPFEKKFTQFSETDIRNIAATFHAWQTVGTVDSAIVQTQHVVETGHAPSLRKNGKNGKNGKYANVPEYCYAATIDEVRAKDYSLVPSKYIEFVNRDENVDFDEKMRSLQTEMADLLRSEAQSKQDLLTVFKELGYEIEL
jgi:type I restriction enzyme M protein